MMLVIEFDMMLVIEFDMKFVTLAMTFWSWAQLELYEQFPIWELGDSRIW
jgi:hypothetical protein